MLSHQGGHCECLPVYHHKIPINFHLLIYPYNHILKQLKIMGFQCASFYKFPKILQIKYDKVSINMYWYFYDLINFLHFSSEGNRRICICPKNILIASQFYKQLIIQIIKDQMRISFSFLFLLQMVQIHMITCQLCIKRATLTTFSTTLTFTFDTAFTSMPDFAYAIQSLSFQQAAVNFKHQIISSSLTSFKIRINITTLNVFLAHNDRVTLAFLFTNYSRVQMNAVSIPTLSATVSLKRSHMYRTSISFSLSIFALTVPANWQLTSKSSINFGIQFLVDPGVEIIFSYVLVEKTFISSKVFVLFDLIDQIRRDFVILIDSQNYLTPSDQNSFLGLSQAVYSSTHLRLNKFVIYSFFDASSNRPAIKTGYMSTASIITLLSSSFIAFNPSYSNCPASNYLSYSTPYRTIAQSCRSCDLTCQSCTSSQQDSAYTDQRYCLTCPVGRYMQLQPNFDYGQCFCLKGTFPSSDGTCVGCSFNCLKFEVTFMKSETQAVFLMVFTQSDLTYVIPFEQNLNVSINGKIVNYSYQQTTTSVYKIILQNEDMKPCQQNCQVMFKFQIPHYIYVTNNSKYLTKQQQIISIEDFYIVGDRLPDQLNQAFLISGLLMGASTATGQAALIKMIFELEQIIEVHKYLNIQIPVVFKQFIEALSACRFLDITVVIDYDINKFIRQLSPNTLDLKGAPKIIYYQNGVNFYKNMVPVIVSMLIIMIFNLFFYAALRLIPLQATRKFAYKMQVRWLISLSDIIQTLVIPISLFAAFQLSYISYRANTVWIYLLTFIFCLVILLFPFYAIIYTDKLRKTKNQVDLEIVGDLFLDCKIHSRVAQVYYLYNYMKKFMFGVFLSMTFSGLIQLFILITINIFHMLLIIYIIVHKIYNSRLKILTRSINLLCVIALEGIILGYNMNYNNVEGMILMGVTCTYLTIIVTVIGIVEIFIKMFQVIFQKIKGTEDDQLQATEGQLVQSNNDQTVKINNYTKNKQGPAMVIDFQSQNGSIQDNTRSENQYKEDALKEKENQVTVKKLNNIPRIGRRKISTQVPESLSENSQIVPIDSSDVMKETIQYQEFGRKEFYRRPVDRVKKIKQKMKEKNIQNSGRKPTIFEYEQNDLQRRGNKGVSLEKKITETKKSIQSNDRRTMASIQQKTKQSIQSTGRQRRKPKRAIYNNANKGRLMVEVKNPKKPRNIQAQSSMSDIVSIQQN